MFSHFRSYGDYGKSFSDWGYGGSVHYFGLFAGNYRFGRNRNFDRSNYFRMGNNAFWIYFEYAKSYRNYPSSWGKYLYFDRNRPQ